jgi:two-component system sensor histidine kinase and response regulator WspE
VTPEPSKDATLIDLFRVEAESQAAVLSDRLLALERDPRDAEVLTALMRAAHSLKGAARIVHREGAVRVAHAMEDWFVAAQQGKVTLGGAHIDALLAGVDLLKEIARLSDEEALARAGEHDARLRDIEARFGAAAPGADSKAPVPRTSSPQPSTQSTPIELRISAAHLDHLLALSGETLVAGRWIGHFAADLLRLKRVQGAAIRQLGAVREAIEKLQAGDAASAELASLKEKLATLERESSRTFAEFDGFDRRFGRLAQRLHQEVMDCRMRPFGDGTQAFPRMVRDIARSLGKQVRLEVLGDTTPVDRMLLAALDAPLGHLVRNAIDHGIETPAERRAAGKADEGIVRIEARCSGGKLLIVVSDDGRGIDPERIREAVIARGLAGAGVARGLSEGELFEFLFLPGFSLKPAVTEISGRGVGLDVVQTMARQVGATVRIISRPGEGSHVQLHLPLTLSVVRAIVAEIGGEPYAFPVARVVSVAHIAHDTIESVEGRQHAPFRGERLGLVDARQVFNLGGAPSSGRDLAVVVLGDRNSRVGLVVDRLLGEGEFVIRPLDARLNKVKDIAAGALMPDGSPVLVVDVEDLVRSIENLVSGGRLSTCVGNDHTRSGATQKRILVVDDSLTVRELERKLLVAAGYEVEVAVDGMDGWNAVHGGNYDLVVTDIDMPRVDGIELVSLIRRDPRLHATPVMIISYKDRDEDRRRGLEAGADYYLPKASFHDDALVNAVRDLIGAAA